MTQREAIGEDFVEDSKAPAGPFVTYVNAHLISDSTGETLNTIMRAISDRFENMDIIDHSYYLVRSRKQLQRVFREIEDRPGIVLFTIFNNELRTELETMCKYLGAPAISVLDSGIDCFSQYLGQEQSHKVGHHRIHDADYFKRIDAMNFILSHDDGQGVVDLEEADVVLVGVSRTSKTPTSVYLANRGIKTANVPLVPGAPLPENLFGLKKPLIVGLKVNPERLIQIRRNRLLNLQETRDTSYVEEDAVRQEMLQAMRIFERYQWPVIDVTRRSVEETAAAILNLLAERDNHD